MSIHEFLSVVVIFLRLLAIPVVIAMLWLLRSMHREIREVRRVLEKRFPDDFPKH